MCTVSYVFSNGKVIITSNRDEQLLRPSAIEPKLYVIKNKNIIFPKDQKAGGTWYAIKDDATILVLLNGAKEKHDLKQTYRKSRGLIVLDLISAKTAISEWKLIDLSDIEPFTLVLFESKKLYQLRWNEVEKETIILNENQNYIWSSSTLYSTKTREEREDWFRQFTFDKTLLTPSDMYDFHRYKENENQENGLTINRNNKLKTLSITQTTIDGNTVKLSYFDLQKELEFNHSYLIS
jgi:uncharacterized protein with NRDE domain